MAGTADTRRKKQLTCSAPTPAPAPAPMDERPDGTDMERPVRQGPRDCVGAEGKDTTDNQALGHAENHQNEEYVGANGKAQVKKKKKAWHTAAAKAKHNKSSNARRRARKWKARTTAAPGSATRDDTMPASQQ